MHTTWSKKGALLTDDSPKEKISFKKKAHIARVGLEGPKGGYGVMSLVEVFSILWRISDLGSVSGAPRIPMLSPPPP